MLIAMYLVYRTPEHTGTNELDSFFFFSISNHSRPIGVVTDKGSNATSLPPSLAGSGRYYIPTPHVGDDASCLPKVLLFSEGSR